MIQKDSTSPKDLQNILKASNSIIQFVRKRKSKKPSQDESSDIYELAKEAQTHSRDLYKAALLYQQAACKGKRVDSCIKDFASIMHQMGVTKYAVDFLINVKENYCGNPSRFNHLLNTLQRQLNPSVKHSCTSLLIEMPPKPKPTNPLYPQTNLIQQMFKDTTRIKSCKFYNHLDFNLQLQEGKGKWVVLEFSSFSAAKKTLDRFRREIWFGVNIFWLREEHVICEAINGWDDFETGLVVTDQLLKAEIEKYYPKLEWNDTKGDLQLINYLSIRLIGDELLMKSRQLLELSQ